MAVLKGFFVLAVSANIKMMAIDTLKKLLVIFYLIKANFTGELSIAQVHVFLFFNLRKLGLKIGVI